MGRMKSMEMGDAGLHPLQNPLPINPKMLASNHYPLPTTDYPLPMNPKMAIKNRADANQEIDSARLKQRSCLSHFHKLDKPVTLLPIRGAPFLPTET